MNKLRPIDITLRQVINNSFLGKSSIYLLTITYRFGNIYTAKTFSFNTCLKLLIEQDKLVRKYPYLKRKSVIDVE